MTENTESSAVIEPPINVILDPSAFTSGIAYIHKWVEEFPLSIFVPDYTLRELDFMKKGVSFLATNARESIRLIDRMTSMQEDGFFFQEKPSIDDPSMMIDQRKNKNKTFLAKMSIQGPNEVGPRYEKCCAAYKIKAPLIKEFPNQKTELDSTSVAGLKKATTNNQFSFSQSSPSQQNGKTNPNAKAQIPPRLRYLIRTCVQKEYVEDEAHWRIITEDPIIRIWAESFGFETMNLRQLDNLLHHREEQDHIMSTDQYYNSANTATRQPLMNAYDENSNRSNKKKSQRRKGSNVSASTTTVEPARKEKFETMTYADRGVGQLWKP